MHFSTLIVSLSAFAATSMAVPTPEPMGVAGEVRSANNGLLKGSLPKNLAKIWVYTGSTCDVNAGPSYNIYVLPDQDRCVQYQNVGSIIAWYKSSIG